MRSLFIRWPTPLVSGRWAGYALLAFYAWLSAVYVALGVYPIGTAPNPNLLVSRPAFTVAGVAIALVLALAFAWGLGSKRTGMAAVRVLGALVVAFVPLVALQAVWIAGALPAAIWIYLLPSIAFALWTLWDAQSSARLLSGVQSRCDGAAAWPESRRLLGRLLVLIGTLWTVELLLASVNRYYRLVALADTARYNQVFFHTLHGRPGFESIDGINHLGVHFTPTLALLLPVYALAPGSLTLLVLQSLALGLAAIPLWYLALHVTQSRKGAFTVTAIYLLHPHVQGININGFRENGLWPLVGFTYLLALEQREFWRKPWFWVLLVLALGVKEEIPVTVAAISLALFIQGRERMANAVIIVIAGVWFVATTKGLMPWLLGPAGHPERGSGWLFTDHFAEMLPTSLQSYGGYVLNAALNPLLGIGLAARPAVIAFLLSIGAPLLFLPLLAGWYGVMLVPSLLLTNVFSSDASVYSTLTKNIGYLVPLFYCALYGWRRAAAWLERRQIPDGGPIPYVALLVTLLFLTQSQQHWRSIEPERTTVRRYVEALPGNLRVVVPNCLSPAASSREVVRWVSATQRFDDIDLVIGESRGTLCRGENFGFPELERAVVASGQFVREEGPIPSVTVYRRKAP